MTIGYDPKRITPEKLARIITDLGYKVEEVEPPGVGTGAKKQQRVRAPMPDDAPKFFREAFGKARRANHPLVIDFWAEWCPPCLQLKEVTFHDPEVARLLEKVQLIYVDLDQYPALGKAYGVQAIPDVFLVDRKGWIVDRLQDFEPPDAFFVRLRKLLAE